MTMSDPDGVYVHPRYLAGSTAIGDPGLKPALDAGWEISHDELGNAYLPSPDQRIRIGYMPEGDDDALWKIAAYENQFAAPRWAAAFSDACPTEFVTAFTTALVGLHQGDGFLQEGLGRADDPHPVLSPLTDAGWTVTDNWWISETTSPDGLAGARYCRGALDHNNELTSNKTRWQMWGGTGYAGWYAVFSTHTPTRLVTATATALADPAPVVRWKNAFWPNSDHVTVTPVRPPAPTPLDILRARRSVPALRTVAVPRWSTSTPSARLPAPARPAARRR
ncbi:DUF317 domain-containing protein [Streptomyces sp. NPDC020875]|uniref:DUF317 domain-containing protein n=1 Tax=Streptomyces sp. NPDC020875 TaxID=3154898 RepID=UPI0033E36569